MKRPSLVLLVGIAIGFLAFAATSWLESRPHRRLLEEPASELAWLRHEYGLSDSQFQRVVALHTAYQPTCAELCQRIADANRRLRDAIAATNVVTDEIRLRLRETGQARDDCRQAMLNHLFSVARELPADAGHRYLESMLAATCVLQEARPIHAANAEAATPGGDAHHHHP